MNPKGKSFLTDIEIFSNLNSEELSQVESILEKRTTVEGEVLFREGDPGKEMFIVKEGVVSIIVTLSDGEELTISRIEGGNFFGDMSIFEQAPRSATCRCESKTELYTLKDQAFFDLMDSHPQIAAKVLYRMLNITAERLHHTGNFLSDMVKWGEDARKRAVTDQFTGLFNRRYLDSTLEEQLREATMRKSAFSLAMIDLDHFGDLNNEYGEQAGNDVILVAVEVFKQVFEDEDILGRYGGDEFTCIFPGQTGEEALKKCSVVCAALRKHPILEGYKGTMKNITSSIGVAEYPRHGKSVKEVQEAADSALYRAKEAGRDRAEKVV